MHQQQLPRRYRLGIYTFEPATGILCGESDSVTLRPKVARLLQLLVESSPAAITRDELTGLIWPNTHVASGSLPRIVSELRDALNDEPEAIQTLPRRGYQLGLEVSEDITFARQRSPFEHDGQVTERDHGKILNHGTIPRIRVALAALAIAAAVVVWLQSRTNASSAPHATRGEHERRALRGFQAGYRSWGLWNSQSMRDALAQFITTARTAPDLWYGYTGMADSYIGRLLLESDPTPNLAVWAEQAAHKATELGPRVAAAHCTLGTVKLIVHWDWEGADASFARALDINPFSYVTYQRRGVLRTLERRFDLANADLRRALELQPEHSDATVFLGWSRFCAGDFEGALQVLEVIPANPGKRRESFRILAATHGMLGDFDAARAALGRAGLSEIDHLAARAWVDATAGNREAALDGLEQLHAILREHEGHNRCDAPAAHAALGQYDEAFASLEAQADARHWKALLALVDPRLEALRSDTRWQRFVQRVRGGRNAEHSGQPLYDRPDGIKTAPRSTRSVSDLRLSHEPR